MKDLSVSAFMKLFLAFYITIIFLKVLHKLLLFNIIFHDTNSFVLFKCLSYILIKFFPHSSILFRNSVLLHIIENTTTFANTHASRSSLRGDIMTLTTK